MKKNIGYSFFILGFLFLTGGCAQIEAGQGSPSFGDSVRQNIAAQVVNPDAAENKGAPVYSGERAALAQKRYLLNTVEKVEAPATSSIGGTSGGAE
jgi:hypothetical protein